MSLSSERDKPAVSRNLESNRSPDVILGLPVSAAVDVLSLGGVLVTMYLGSLPFPQRCQYLVKTMVETLGQPEDKLLDDSYFRPNQDSTTPAWRLKHPSLSGQLPAGNSGFYPQLQPLQRAALPAAPPSQHRSHPVIMPRHFY